MEDKQGFQCKYCRVLAALELHSTVAPWTSNSTVITKDIFKHHCLSFGIVEKFWLKHGWKQTGWMFDKIAVMARDSLLYIPRDKSAAWQRSAQLARVE